jgi:hypothetical protein
MTGLRNTALAALAGAAALAAGCGDTHIEDCEGGLFVTVTVDSALLEQADELYMRLSTIQGVEERTWPATELSSGTGTALIHFPSITENLLVTGYAELLTEGDVVIATALQSTTVRPADTGCFPMSLSLADPDLDAGASLDAGVTDAPVNQPDADPDAPDAAPTPDADPAAPDAAKPVDAGIPDAALPTDATVDAMVDAMIDADVPIFDDGGVVIPHGDGGIPPPK